MKLLKNFSSLQREQLFVRVFNIYYDHFTIVQSEYANCPSEQILRQVIILHNCMNIAFREKKIIAPSFSQDKNVIATPNYLSLSYRFLIP